MTACAFCRLALERHPHHGAEALVTFVDQMAVHSGHCESETLRLKKKSRITAFPMPRDLEALYGTG